MKEPRAIDRIVQEIKQKEIKILKAKSSLAVKKLWRDAIQGDYNDKWKKEGHFNDELYNQITN